MPKTRSPTGFKRGSHREAGGGEYVQKYSCSYCEAAVDGGSFGRCGSTISSPPGVESGNTPVYDCAVHYTAHVTYTRRTPPP
eukprot:COSAG02_NODE_2329_length_9121_cov_3.015183_5_plen_82_part_00